MIYLSVSDSILPVLRARRVVLRFSQAYVAERSGTQQSYYSKLEQGKHDPRLGTLQDIARTLSLEVMLVPAELVDTVKHLTGRGEAPDEQPLFFGEPD